MATFTSLSGEPRTLQILQMKGQRGRHEADAFADCTSRQSFRALFDQQTINGQTMFMSERAQSLYYL
jgi:hypothetical protein